MRSDFPETIVPRTELTIADVAFASNNILNVQQGRDSQDEMIQRFVDTFEPEHVRQP